MVDEAISEQGGVAATLGALVNDSLIANQKAEQAISEQEGMAATLGALSNDSLIASQKAEQAITDAAAWFKKQGDPLLTRVAQNVFLYFIVENFINVSGTDVWTRGEAKNRSELVAVELQQFAADWLKGILDEAPTNETREMQAKIRSFMTENKLTQTRLVELLATPQALSQRLFRQLGITPNNKRT